MTDTPALDAAAAAVRSEMIQLFYRCENCDPDVEDSLQIAEAAIMAFAAELLNQLLGKPKP